MTEEQINTSNHIAEAARKSAELLTLTKPLMIWLDQNYHPHVTLIITPSDAQLVESIMSTGMVTDHLRD